MTSCKSLLMCKDNATWLFQEPDRRFHNSESWWSSLFGLLLLYLAKRPGNGEIPLRRYVSKPKWKYVRDGSLDYHELEFKDILVEPKLSGEVFGGIKWPKEFVDLKPDILVLRPKPRMAVLIENKTIGARFGKQLERYIEIRHHLKASGWSVEFLPLLSVGFEAQYEWENLEKHHLRLILWEDVLRLLDTIELFRAFFAGVELRTYYSAPLRESP